MENLREAIRHFPGNIRNKVFTVEHNHTVLFLSSLSIKINFWEQSIMMQIISVSFEHYPRKKFFECVIHKL